MIERHRLLAAASAALAASLDYDQTVRALCGFAVENVADWCLLQLRGEDGASDRRELATSVAGAQALAETLRQLPSPDAPSLLDEALKTRQARLVAPAALPAWAETPFFVATGARAAMVVPLCLPDLATGALLLWTTRPERRYAEADLEAVQGLAELSARALDHARLYQIARNVTSARNEVLNVVAHDLRSPLNGVLLTLDFLAEKLAERGAADLVDPWVTGMLSSARAMNRIIGELLEITRLEARPVKLDRRPLDVDYLVDLVLRDARHHHPGLVLEARVAPHLPTVEGDEERIRQVLGYLIANLVKFRIEDEGALMVAVDEAAAGLRFSVTDARSPTAPDELEHLFDRFWQAGHADRRGAALGLSIARMLVLAHGGRIWAESSAADGTTFFFTLAGAAAA